MRTLHIAMVLALIAVPVSAGSLGKEMKEINRITKKLSKLAGDFGEGEKLAKEAVEASRRAKEILPDAIEDEKDPEKKKVGREEYSKMMDQMAEAYAAAEAACQKKDAAGLQQALDALTKLKKDGHTKYEVD